MREAIAWARQHGAWDLLRRFSYAASLELVDQLRASGCELRMRLTMATIVEPIVQHDSTARRIAFQSLLLASDWSYAFATDDNNTVGAGHTVARQIAPKSPLLDDESRCELALDIETGRIVDGLFDGIALIDTEWVGVAAIGLIMRNVDVVGCRFYGCDLSHSVWLGGDARQVTMLGANLSHSLLQDVKLHGAVMTGIECGAAVLERVDLRNADLRNACFNGSALQRIDLRNANLRDVSFAGADLDDVDLRGADLRGADFSGARVHRLKLQGCRLEGSWWAGVRYQHGYAETDTPMMLQLIEQTAVEPQRTDTHIPLRRERPIGSVVSSADRYFAKVDLRGAALEQAMLSKRYLVESDMRAAKLAGAQLMRADLSGVCLRAGLLHAAEFSDAVLSRADLRAAQLPNAHLERVVATGAQFRAANLRSSWLTAGQLQQANFAGADLSSADLTGANLSGANLSGANLTGARLAGANLTSAILDDANLEDADLTQAILTDASCIRTSFRHATIDLVQLTHAAWIAYAELPDGMLTQQMDGYYEALDDKETSFRLSELSGTFYQTHLQGRDLWGAHLSGLISGADLSDADLRYARLSGNFVNVNFHGAQLAHARLSGEFSACAFGDTDLEQADMHTASLVRCDLRQAKNLQREQLEHVQRLRGSCLPTDAGLPARLADGWYDGSLRLSGDLDDARRFGYDPENRDELQTEFYLVDYVVPRL
jgi:uncharacterized protein YjbI with pentapeptide repeats